MIHGAHEVPRVPMPHHVNPTFILKGNNISVVPVFPEGDANQLASHAWEVQVGDHGNVEAFAYKGDTPTNQHLGDFVNAAKSLVSRYGGYAVFVREEATEAA